MSFDLQRASIVSNDLRFAGRDVKKFSHGSAECRTISRPTLVLCTVNCLQLLSSPPPPPRNQRRSQSHKGHNIKQLKLAEPMHCVIFYHTVSIIAVEWAVTSSQCVWRAPPDVDALVKRSLVGVSLEMHTLAGLFLVAGSTQTCIARWILVDYNDSATKCWHLRNR